MATRNEEILNNVLDFAIEKYIQPDERNELLKKFKSDKMGLVIFLREREFSKLEEEKPVSKSKAKKTAIKPEEKEIAPVQLVEQKKNSRKKKEYKSEPTLF